MKFEIKRNEILKALQHLSGVVERRQTLPVLANILVDASDGMITLTATDLEVEIIVKEKCKVKEDGQITIPARKWLDICRNLDEKAVIKVSLKQGDKDNPNSRAVLQAGKSRFTLATLPASEFPLLDEVKGQTKFAVAQGDLKTLFDATHFSMAQQDVRYYLNGLMMEMSAKLLRCVATDGHRLALKDLETKINIKEESRQVIIPRKGVQELMRLLSDSDDDISVTVDSNHIRIEMGDITFTTKLIDGRFPDYRRVLPEGGKNILSANKESLRQIIVRVSILSNEKYRGIRLILKASHLKIVAHNPDQEEAEDELEVEYSGEDFEIGFNATYLMEAINAVVSEQVKIELTDPNSSCLIKASSDESAKYVVMPMRL